VPKLLPISLCDQSYFVDLRVDLRATNDSGNNNGEVVKMLITMNNKFQFALIC